MHKGNKWYELASMLRRHEGERQFAYQCPDGKLTIGVGRNIDERGGIGLDRYEIEQLLLRDIARCEQELDGAFGWYRRNLRRQPARRDALIDLCFNIGLTRLQGFVRMLDAMETGDYEGAAAELLDSRYARQVGGRARELAAMIRTGEYQQ